MKRGKLLNSELSYAIASMGHGEGNILLYSGVDAPVWFSKQGLNVPEVYAKRVEQMKKGKSS